MTTETAVPAPDQAKTPGARRPRGMGPIHLRAPGLVRRFLTTQRHFLGLLAGAFVAAGEQRPRRWPGRLTGAVIRPFVDRELARAPFPVQLRRRMEKLGPTYIKLGQILSLRRDLLPDSVTGELRNLLDRVPAAPFEAVSEVVAADLGRPLDELFRRIDPEPLGSASIAQIHRAETADGQDVVLKIVKPGIRELLHRDATLIRLLGRLLQAFMPHLQPQRLIDEFFDYTLREAEMTWEADNAETFAAGFEDMPEIVFPRVYRELSGRDVLCLERLEGMRPDSAEALALPESERRWLIDVGAQAVIRMLYQHGFFHADLHPANILLLPGPRIGFLDLGMVGRLGSRLRRALLYYYYCLVIEDYENASRYLATIADPAPGADPAGFRREVEEISRRWRLAATVREYSLAQLILESVRHGAHYRMYFPVEMVLMVKALVTYEGVGLLLDPEFNVTEVTHRHVVAMFRHEFSAVRLLREGTRRAPDILDALIKLPTLVTEGLRLVEQRASRPLEKPLSGLGGTLYGGFCLLSAAILAAVSAPWPVWGALLALGVLLPWRRR
ncbi:MAG: AarF/ABC1/UbiB kinase family protein [Acidobacteria bacterium]|jgi:ubiquinone biosynthesis protein|nr:AarF/ABC1/UbiB kinase family protein [Acidobacteriota bacterium]